MSSSQITSNRILHLNVGFLLKEGVGVMRVLPFDERNLTLGDLRLETLTGTLDLSRTTQGILVGGQLDAQISGECTRCLTPVMTPASFTLSEHFLYPPATAGADDYAVSEGGVIDLSPVARENIILATPMHVLCRQDCRGLCSQCGQNLNDAVCECEYSAIDPRMEGLRVLLDDY